MSWLQVMEHVPPGYETENNNNNNNIEVLANYRQYYLAPASADCVIKR
jgi:hypothetical protein